MLFNYSVGKRAMRIFKLIRTLEREILEYGNPETLQVVRLPDDEVTYKMLISFPHIKGQRITYLNHWEYQFLCSNPELVEILSRCEADLPFPVG